MEGYSVTEAASVLGVPTERVWELLARGVLSGAAEGETGMRVYLQPRPAPSPVEPKAPNGNGGAREPERELSPFRELLTEFRNLTERYGQALLALGEARGEVAALRSRVDLLEARMDLRLPMGSPQAAGWSSTPMPAPIERAVMPARTESATQASSAASGDASADVAVEHEPSEEERRTRARGPRRATESFAEALARAEDPSPPELPGGTEAAAALAALRHQPDETAAEVGLPREVASADAIPVADTDDALLRAEPEPVEPARETEPMVGEAHATFEPPEEPVPLAAIAETQPSPAEAVPVETESETETAADGVASAPESPPEPEGEPQPPVAAQPEPEPESPPEVFAVEEPEALEVEIEVERFVEADEPEPVEEEIAAAEAAAATPKAEPLMPEVEPIAWDAERYTTDIEEPDWFAAEVVEPIEPAAVPPVPDVPPSAEPAASAVEPDAAKDAVDEPEQGSGAEEMEVAPSATQPDARQPRAQQAFPGARDLEDAIAALRAAGRAAEPPLESERGGEIGEDAPAETNEWPPRSTFGRSPTSGTESRGSASRAYRRLRRIFPG